MVLVFSLSTCEAPSARKPTGVVNSWPLTDLLCQWYLFNCNLFMTETHKNEVFVVPMGRDQQPSIQIGWLLSNAYDFVIIFS